MKGTRVKGFRKRWWTVCCDVGLGQFVCPVCYPELQKRKQEKQTVDAKGQCSDCGKKWERAKLMYAGLLFHDLRRSGIRNLIREGVQQKVAQQISGHKTASVFQRYNIIDKRDITDAGRRLNAKQNANAQLSVPQAFGHVSGMNNAKIAEKPRIADSLEAVIPPSPLPN